MPRTLSSTPIALFLCALAAACGQTHLDPIGLKGTGGVGGAGAGGTDARGGTGASVAGSDTGGSSANGGTAGTSGSAGTSTGGSDPRGGSSAGGSEPGGSGGALTEDSGAGGAPGTGGADSGVTPCDPDAGDADPCHPWPVTQVVAGERFTCALLSNGSVKCWGGNYDGQLGYGHTDNIGDNELPSSVGYVSVTTTPGLSVTALAAGQQHVCALLSDGSVTCWGDNAGGQLGYGHTEAIGDNELPSSAGPISVSTTPGVTVTALTAGWSHTCALLSDGSVTCWGRYGTGGGLGYGNTETIGDNELPSSAGAMSLTETPGVTATALGGGAFHTCAILSDTSVTCWGRNHSGQLGYGNLEPIGDNELPSSAGRVSVTTTDGESVTAIAAGYEYTCALLSSGSVKCWGNRDAGRLGVGYGNTETIGDNELPSSVGAIALTTMPDVSAIALTGGFFHSCALLSDLTVKCWGWNGHGQLGTGDTEDIGDNELPSSVGAPSITTAPGVTITALAPGSNNYHNCAVLSDGSVTCWGFNADAALGYGMTEDIGDDELPSSVGSVVLF